jgi:nucleoside phosphorylase
MPLIDFAIITALLEEFEAVKAALPGELVEDSTGANIWFRTTLLNSKTGKKLQVVITYQSKMGAFDAISITKDCIDRWQPAYIIMTGIAGSFHPAIKLGHIAVSQQIFYYDMGKSVDQKKTNKVEYRPQGYPCSPTLIRQAERLSLAKGGWQKKGQQAARKMAAKLKSKGGGKTLIKMLEDHLGAVHFGTMASGSLVITSENKKNELLKLHGKIIATEMEGAGIMHQAYYQEPTVSAIIIKGISDGAYSKKASLDKEGRWRTLAKQNAANFVVELIQTGSFQGLDTDEFVLAPQKGSPALARNLINRPTAPDTVSFLSFPGLIKPQGPLTGVTIEIKADPNTAAQIRQMVIQYVDSTNKLQTLTVENNDSVTIEGYISRSPIGVYLMVIGEVNRLRFTVHTFGNKQAASIQITD